MSRTFFQKLRLFFIPALITIIALLAGRDFFEYFLGPARVFNQLSGQWLAIAIVWGLALLLLPVAVWFSIWKSGRVADFTHNVETIRAKVGPGGWLATTALLALLIWVYLFSPWKQVFTYLLDSIWLHAIILFWAAQFFGACISSPVGLFSGRREFWVTIILLLLLKILGPLFYYYSGILAVLIVLAVLALLHQYRPGLIPSLIQRAEPGWEKVTGTVWFPTILVALGLVVYLVQARQFFYTNASIMDEGSYVYKGFLFALGKLVPYQDYGAWTNKAPLSFLIPGYIQAWFEPGLRTARLMAIVTQLIFLPGLLIAAHRMGGRWGVVAATLAIAFVPTQISVYSAAFSQGIIACIMVWVLVFTLGEDRPVWQLMLGGFLSGVIFMTRENLLPLPILLVLYVFWQYGFKKASLAAAAALIPVVFLTTLYWPNILRIWVFWIPKSITPFLNPWRHLGGGNRIWAFDIAPFSTRATSFWNGVNIHFIPFVGCLALLLFWPLRNRVLRTTWRWRSAIFLAVTYLILALAHAWASFMTNECVFCFAGYMSFFSSLGILFVITAWPLVQAQRPAWRGPALILLLITASAGAAFTMKDSMERLLFTRLPSAQDSSLLWKILDNNFGLDFNISRQIIPTLAGAVLCILILLGVWMAFKALPDGLRQKASFWKTSLLLTLVGMSLLNMGLSMRTIERGCKADVIQTYERAGAYLANIVPPGSKVYWLAESPILLLYLDVEVFPPQLNDGFGFFRGSDTDQALRYGYWNDEAAHEWQLEADYALVEKSSSLVTTVNFVSEEYQEIGQTEPLFPCDPSSAVLVLKHLK